MIISVNKLNYSIYLPRDNRLKNLYQKRYDKIRPLSLDNKY